MYKGLKRDASKINIFHRSTNVACHTNSINFDLIKLTLTLNIVQKAVFFRTILRTFSATAGKRYFRYIIGYEGRTDEISNKLK